MATTTTTTTYTASAEMWMDEGPLRWRGVTRDAGGRIVGECFHLHRTEAAGLACASVCARAWTRHAVAEVEAARTASAARRAAFEAKWAALL